MPSNAYQVFLNRSSSEISSIITIFEERNAKRGPNTDYALLHGALTLLVSGWETYCEDVSREAVTKIIDAKKITFNQLAPTIQRAVLKFSYPDNLSNKDPLQTNLAKLPEDGWKTLIKDMVDNYLQDFNTPKFSRPKGKNLNALFEKYLSKNVRSELDVILKDSNYSAKIDKIVSIRGDIAHRGQPTTADQFNADGLRGYLATITKACAAIERIIWDEFRDKYNVTPWNITKTVTTIIPWP